MMGGLPRKGVYALLLQVTRDTKIEVGRLGWIEFPSGIYVYIGSALNSLPARVQRHFAQVKRQHWHIDYLTRADKVKPVGYCVRRTSRKIECSVSKAVEASTVRSIRKFGSSDCHCDSHLHFFSTLHDATQALLAQQLQLRRMRDSRIRE